MPRRGLVMTAAQVEAHQRKHFGRGLPAAEPEEKPKEPKPRMNKTETAYAAILESRKLRGEVLEYKFEGISLSWGEDPETEKPMWYTPDFIVWPFPGGTEVHEVKGGFIRPQDLIRFKGCRAEWGKHFKFQLHQKSKGEWRRLH